MVWPSKSRDKETQDKKEKKGDYLIFIKRVELEFAEEDVEERCKYIGRDLEKLEENKFSYI